MGDVTAILLNCMSTDPLVRDPAVAQTQQAQEQDLAGFLLALVGEIRDETKPSNSRQMASILLKNSVALKLRDEKAREKLEQKWRAIPAAVRTQVKGEVLSTLSSPNKEVRYVVALVIANLARIELPCGEWDDLLTLLVGAVDSGNDQHMEAALTTLGYICEEANVNESLEGILCHQSLAILTAIVKGMEWANDDVKYYATNALCNSLEFVQGTMDVDEQRDYLLGVVCANCQAPTEQVRMKAMECLCKIARLYYEKLPRYIETIFTITTRAVHNDVESVGLQALQFWSAICEVERELKEESSNGLNFAQQAKGVLMEIITEFLLKQVEGQGEDDWNLSIASTKLLQDLAECIGNEIVAPTMDFVYRLIDSANWREREAACMAFGCILLGPDPKMMETAVAQAVPGLLQYMGDPHPLVADTAAWVTSLVALQFVDCLIVRETLQRLLDTVGQLLRGSCTAADRGCSIIHNIGLNFEEEEDLQTYALSPYFEDLCSAIMATLDREDITDNLRKTAQETLNVLLGSAANDCFPTLRRLIPEILRRLQATIQAYQEASSRTSVTRHQGLLCGSLNYICAKLGNEVNQMAADIIGVLVPVFQCQTDSVETEELLFVGALAQAMGPNFASYMDAVAPYLSIGMQQKNDFETFSVSIGAIGDIVSAIKDKIGPWCDGIMTQLTNTVRDPATDRDLHAGILGCMGDIALNIRSNFGSYLNVVMTIYREMDQQAKTLLSSTDPDDQEYVYGVWTAMCQSFSGISQGFKEDLAQLAPYIEFMVEFCASIGTHIKDDDECLRACIGAIGDMANVAANAGYINEARGLLLDQRILAMINHASRSTDDETKDQCTWTMNELQAFQS